MERNSGDSCAIRVEGVSKKYRLYRSPDDRVKEALHPFRKSYHTDFWALRDVSFEVPKGQTLGILGRNGSGKSTLLQIIAEIFRPTEGTVSVDGRVSALLELGAGFNPEFTGRDNAVFSGTLAGRNEAEMRLRMPEIEAFADIGEFIDQPVRTYSSGMYARLAFATAILLDPDILIVDEILSVGDTGFQQKCFDRLFQMKKRGTTILFVSHNIETVVNLTDLAILLEGGRMIAQGRPKNVAEAYRRLLFQEATKSSEYKWVGKLIPGSFDDNAHSHLSTEAISEFCTGRIEEDRFPVNPGYNRNEHIIGPGKARLVNYLTACKGVISKPVFSSGDVVQFWFRVKFEQPVHRPIFGMALRTVEGVFVYGANSTINPSGFKIIETKDGCVFCFSLTLTIQSGDYFMDVAVSEISGDERRILHRRGAAINILITSTPWFNGLADLKIHPVQM